jgi:hypothetical protein
LLIVDWMWWLSAKAERKYQDCGQTPTNRPPTSTAVRPSKAASPSARGTTIPSGVTKSMPTETGRDAGDAGFGRRVEFKEG